MVDAHRSPLLPPADLNTHMTDLSHHTNYLNKLICVIWHEVRFNKDFSFNSKGEIKAWLGGSERRGRMADKHPKIAKLSWSKMSKETLYLTNHRHSPLWSFPFMAVTWASWATKQNTQYVSVHVLLHIHHVCRSLLHFRNLQQAGIQRIRLDILSAHLSLISKSTSTEQQRVILSWVYLNSLIADYLQKLQLIKCQIFDWHLNKLQRLVIFLSGSQKNDHLLL